MKQSEIFLAGEGDQWYRRNVAKPRLDPDPVLDIIKSEGITPDSVLEIGCGDGWRLDLIKKEFGSECIGMDPSVEALTGIPDGIQCVQSTADFVPLRPNCTDMVIYGFCLYLVDREDLFKVVMECDRVLRDGGHIVIHDFHSDRSYSRRYKHANGVFTYKQDYARLWLGNPAYRMVRRTVTGMAGEQPKDRDDQVSVTILKKDVEAGWPLFSPITTAWSA